MGADLNIGVFYILAVSSVSVVCLLLAGWGRTTNMLYSALFRLVAQLVSYMKYRWCCHPDTLSFWRVQWLPKQSLVPSTFLSVRYSIVSRDFLHLGIGRNGRTPFDLLEAESEIVAGFHVEYGGMKFGMFSSPSSLARC